MNGTGSVSGWRKLLFCWTWLLLCVSVFPVSLNGQEPESSRINVTTPTAGGTQFWTDRFVCSGWRIQRNVLTGHHRLLDDKDFRRAWGSLAGCRTAFDQFREELDLEPESGTLLITLHGLGRSRDSMDGMGEYLSEEGGFAWINVGYASTREPIADHAAALAEIVGSLEKVGEIHFAAHSLGNLVIRRYLAERRSGDQPPLGRIVMLGPPNQGAALAERLKDNPLFKLMFGVSGGQLAKGWDEVEPTLATPSCPFGIIAGGQVAAGIDNPMLEGDDDLVVTVEETRLAGAADFLVIPAFHTFMMDDPEVRRAALRFLQTGSFEE